MRTTRIAWSTLPIFFSSSRVKKKQMEWAQSWGPQGYHIHRARIRWVLERGVRPNVRGRVSGHLLMEGTNHPLKIEILILLPVIWALKLVSKYIQTSHKLQWRRRRPKRHQITSLHSASLVIHNKRRMLISSSETSHDLKGPGAIHIKAPMVLLVVQMWDHRHQCSLLSCLVDFWINNSLWVVIANAKQIQLHASGTALQARH